MRTNKLNSMFFVFSVLFVFGMGIFISHVSEKNNITFNVFSSNSNNMLTGFAAHPLYSSFSSASSGFVFNNNSGLVSASDTVVYRVGYYSVNGSAWQNFTFSGTSYNGDANWLSGSSSRSLPLFGVGEHYVIIYSCTYYASNSSWDCHDNKWQLIVINNTVSGSDWSGELLVNGGFETGTSAGWTVGAGTWTVGHDSADDGLAGPQAGSYCIYNDANSAIENYVYQDVNLTSYASSIDAGNVLINASGWGVSTNYNFNPAWDVTRIQIIFLNSVKGVISTPKDTGYVSNQTWWQTGIYNYQIPANTRYVRVWGNTYEIGHPMSGSLDSFSVKIKSGTCTDTCSSLGYTCGSVCGINCGNYGGGCQTGYYCSLDYHCTVCTTHTLSSCSDGDVYWYNSCGTREEIRYDCTSAQTCSEGVCVTGCTNECTQSGSTQCSGSNIQTCGNYDADSCYEWSDATACPIGQTCVGDVCTTTTGTCGGVTCKSDEYCSNNVCLLSVSGSTYFVSTTGSDSNSGNYSQPWKSWQKAFNTVSAGDAVYIRGGVYYMAANDGNGYMLTTSGTVTNPISILNYPGEVPILDGSRITSGSGPIGLELYRANYIRLRGLVVRNIPQLGTADSSAIGIAISECHDVKIDNCIVYGTGGSGFKTSYGREIYYNNCDAYDNVDTQTAILPGNDGYGFNIWATNTDFTTYYNGCRAWNNGDDGFSGMSNGVDIYTNCWAFNNGQLEGGGNGFKLGWLETQSSSLRRIVTNCLAMYNGGGGITTNEDPTTDCAAMHIYNNLLIGNGWMNTYYFGMYIYDTGDDATEYLRVFRNNICILSNYNDVFVSPNAHYTHSNNNWDSGVTANAIDFVALPTNRANALTILSASRKSDGSLPDLGNYFKLAAGSDLIDAGVNVGLPYSGSAPDLGAFEYS